MNTQRKTAGYITWAVTAVVAVAGIAMSADMLVTLADLSGWGTWTAWLLPVLLDGSGIAGGLTQKFGPTRAARRYGAVVLGESAVLSVLGNVAGHTIEGTTAPVYVAAAVAVVVPVQIVLTVHQGILLSSPAEDTATERETSAPVAEPTETSGATPTETAATIPAVAPAEPAAEPVVTHPVADPTETDSETEPAGCADTETEPAEAELIGPRPMLRAVPAQRPTQRLEVPAEGADTDDTDSSATETVQEAMRRVWDQHLAAGTAEDLTGAELARQAGRGSRQLAGRYLSQWRAETEGASA